MERQLAEAKAFQERIFNSSVDAIMAADIAFPETSPTAIPNFVPSDFSQKYS